MPRPVEHETRRIQVAFRLPPEVFSILPPSDHSGARVEYVVEAIREKHERDTQAAKKRAKTRYNAIMRERKADAEAEAVAAAK